jgi:hypothetical protein
MTDSNAVDIASPIANKDASTSINDNGGSGGGAFSAVAEKLKTVHLWGQRSVEEFEKDALIGEEKDSEMK